MHDSFQEPNAFPSMGDPVGSASFRQKTRVTLDLSGDAKLPRLSSCKTVQTVVNLETNNHPMDTDYKAYNSSKNNTKHPSQKPNEFYKSLVGLF